MYESSLRHPVWVPEINVNPCNSVGDHKSRQAERRVSISPAGRIGDYQSRQVG
jgi:hypothetical protein